MTSQRLERTWIRTGGSGANGLKTFMTLSTHHINYLIISCITPFCSPNRAFRRSCLPVIVVAWFVRFNFDKQVSNSLTWSFYTFSVVAHFLLNTFICKHFNDRLVSCGNDNIRFWRIRHGSLRSCPVDLGRHGSVDFNDIVYGAKDPLSADPTVRKV